MVDKMRMLNYETGFSVDSYFDSDCVVSSRNWWMSLQSELFATTLYHLLLLLCGSTVRTKTVFKSESCL